MDRTRLVLDLGGWAYLTKESLTTESNQGAFVNQIHLAKTILRFANSKKSKTSGPLPFPHGSNLGALRSVATIRFQSALAPKSGTPGAF